MGDKSTAGGEMGETRDTQRVLNDNKDKTAAKNTTAAIKALSAILEKGENNKGANEEGRMLYL